MALPNNTWISDVKSSWIERDYDAQYDNQKPLLLYFSDTHDVGLFLYYDADVYEPDQYHLVITHSDEVREDDYAAFDSLKAAEDYILDHFKITIPSDLLNRMSIDVSYYQVRRQDEITDANTDWPGFPSRAKRPSLFNTEAP